MVDKSSQTVEHYPPVASKENQEIHVERVEPRDIVEPRDMKGERGESLYLLTEAEGTQDNDNAKNLISQPGYVETERSIDSRGSKLGMDIDLDLDIDIYGVE